jgi:beta-phosphoglucomutase-like phosphatase (HAD superfamily)
MSATQSEARTIGALVLDMDGLLVDTEHLAALALERFLDGHGKSMQAGTMERTLGRRFAGGDGDRGKPVRSGRAARFTGRGIRRAPVGRAPGQRPADAGGAGAARLGRSAGLPMALATSSRRTHADLSLDEAGLVGFFAAEVTEGRSPPRQAAPGDLFDRGRAARGHPRAACLVLEDAPAGLAAAVAGGMRCLWVPNDKDAGARGRRPRSTG